MRVKKILVVEDEGNLRELLQICFQVLAGWETKTVASGKECLQVLQTEAFDAIILDISMPEMDGYEVYERLQSDPRTRSIPVILLTAKVSPRDRQRFQQMGVTGAIGKPIDPLALNEEIATLLGWQE